MESRLEGSRFLLGEIFTDADLRLLPTVVRYDAVYNSLFKCTRRRIASDCPNLQAWMQDVWLLPCSGSMRVRIYRNERCLKLGTHVGGVNVIIADVAVCDCSWWLWLCLHVVFLLCVTLQGQPGHVFCCSWLLNSVTNFWRQCVCCWSAVVSNTPGGDASHATDAALRRRLVHCVPWAMDWTLNVRMYTSRILQSHACR